MSLSSNDGRNQHAMPASMANSSVVMYRSVGIGIFGAIMRYAGMPLEKIALYLNSSQVTGKNPFGQATRLTFKEGPLAPYRVVGMPSMTAWFLQYSIMGVAFQFVDHALSSAMGVRPVYYGKELMEEAKPVNNDDHSHDNDGMKFAIKTALAPMIASSFESMVSNRAEVQRYFGVDKLHAMERNFSAATRVVGPAFGANVMRNVIMCQTSFVLTPITYKLYFPQEHKNVSSFFWYSLSMNIFVGNVAAITQQTLWGRSLDYLSNHGNISYRGVIQEGLEKEGIRAFWTGPRWFSRVLMNAPAQGTLPWFYNEVLPLGEPAFLSFVQTCVYEPFLREKEVLRRQATDVVAKATAAASPTPSSTARFTASSPRSQ